MKAGRVAREMNGERVGERVIALTVSDLTGKHPPLPPFARIDDGEDVVLYGGKSVYLEIVGSPADVQLAVEAIRRQGLRPRSWITGGSPNCI